MVSMMKLPDDIFRQELLQYLTVYDIVRLDTACMNHQYRPQLLEKISGVILIGDKYESMEASLYKWLGIRRIYLINMNLNFDRFTPSNIDNNYVDQFKFIQHVVMRGVKRDVTAMFIISHSPCLQSIYISNEDFYYYVTNHTLQSIAEHCTVLQSLSLRNFMYITGTGLISISEHCPNLQSLKIRNCHQISDASIISISAHCAGLQLLDLRGCVQITDASIISISTHCTGLQSLNLEECCQITDASITSISEKCTRLKELFVSGTRITDASLIAISKNCTGLQYLRTHGCNGLSSQKLRKQFNSVFELRTVLLSIFPSLPI